jgi:Spy/CpxP family protein refolding chaperone
MLGFAIGFACLAGLLAVLGSECRRRRSLAWGHGWGHGGCGQGWGHGWSHGGCGGHGVRWGRYAFIAPLLERLETTPGQEKAIRAAVDAVMQAAMAAKGRASQGREPLAAVFRSESFDESLVAAVITGCDEAVEQVRTAMVDGLAKVYEALDPRQRALVAEWLERGVGRHACGAGPYRGGAAKV